jgi:membrane-bound lytic murein transglycosylase B
VHIGPKVERRESDDHETTEEAIPRKGKQKQAKVNPFAQEQKKAELEKAQIEAANRASKDKQKVMEQKRAQRNAERKKHMVRTKRGQPIMANQIQSLLGKLKSETGSR